MYEAVGSPGKRWTVCGTAEGFSEDFCHARIIASRAAQREIWPRIKDWLVSTEMMETVHMGRAARPGSFRG